MPHRGDGDRSDFWIVSGEPTELAGGAPHEPAGPRAGTLIAPGRIVDEGELARGGTSQVRRVRDTHMRRRAAMKILDGDPTAGAALRFRREAQITAQLDHPNVAPVYDVGVTDDGRPCLLMKLVAGTTLSGTLDGRAVHSGKPLGEMLEVLLKVCDAVGFAHARGVIHRDLKPANLMIGAYGEVFVMDWGSARVLPGAEVVCEPVPELDGAGYVVGTPSYMPPEQAQGRTEDVGPRSDVFALGATLYQVLGGRAPFVGSTVANTLEQARLGRTQPLGELDPTVAPGLARIVARALAPEPEARYPGVAELARDLRAFLSGGALLATRRYPAGSVIVKEGEPADCAFIVGEGRCEVYRSEAGARVRLRELGPGGVFGEIGMITAHPRVASVAALEDVVVTVVPREAFADAMALDSWSGALVRALAERFREADELAAELRQRTR